MPCRDRWERLAWTLSVSVSTGGSAWRAALIGLVVEPAERFNEPGVHAFSREVDDREVIEVELGAGAPVARRGAEDARLLRRERHERHPAERAIRVLRAVRGAEPAGAGEPARPGAQSRIRIRLREQLVVVARDRARATDRIEAPEAEEGELARARVIDAQAIACARVEMMPADEDVAALAAADEPTRISAPFSPSRPITRESSGLT
jgi:hypothetical protein